jgi:hypothetical protein
VSPTTVEGIDRTIASTESDEEVEERLFKIGLRRLLEGFGLRGDAS